MNDKGFTKIEALAMAIILIVAFILITTFILEIVVGLGGLR